MVGRAARVAGYALMGTSMMMSRGAAAAGPEAAPRERSIAAQGTGEIRVRPDSARVSLGVDAEAKTLEKAQQTVNDKMASVIKEIQKLDIPNLSMQTQILQVYPIRGKQASGSSELPPIVGYHASNGLAVNVLRRSPESLGGDVSKIVDTGLKAGANDVGGVQLFREDLAAPRDAALHAAVMMAERDARTMAGAARVNLGAPLTIEELPSFSAQPRMLEAAALKLRTETPVEIGEITVSASVSMRFEIH
jgi:hypothetical protein